MKMVATKYMLKEALKKTRNELPHECGVHQGIESSAYRKGFEVAHFNHFAQTVSIHCAVI